MIPLNQIPSDAQCVTCRWWDDSCFCDKQRYFKGNLEEVVKMSDGEEVAFHEMKGYCIRFPPIAATLSANRGYHWVNPETDSWGLCGEWTPLPSKRDDGILSQPLNVFLSSASTRAKRIPWRIAKKYKDYPETYKGDWPDSPTVSDLIAFGRDNLFRLKDIGKYTLGEVEELLRKHNLLLAE